MRVRTVAGLYSDPDASAACGKPEFLDDTRDTLLNPNVICRGAVAFTEAYDRGRKFELYESIPSFTEYLLLTSTAFMPTYSGVNQAASGCEALLARWKMF